MIKGVRVHHFAVSTNNLKRLQQFYCDVLGFEPILEMEWKPETEVGDALDYIIGMKNSAAKVALLSKDGVIFEIFEYSAPVPKPIPSDWKPSDHGYTHLALEVQDIDAAYESLTKAGMTFHLPPTKEFFNGAKCLYGRDPEGHVIEILEIAPTGISTAT